MSVRRDAVLTPQQIALKLACTEAVLAAGGEVFVGRQVGRSQSRISDWCNLSIDEFMPLAFAATVDALGTGKPGHPHIARALALSAGLELGGTVPPSDNSHPAEWIGDVSVESGDLVRALVAGTMVQGRVAATLAAMSANARAAVSRECDQLLALIAGLQTEIQRGEPARRADSS